MVGHGFKYREIRKVLRAEKLPEIAKLFRNVLRLLGVSIGALANVPEKHFTFGPILQRDQSQVEEREEFFAMFERVVRVLAIIHNVVRLSHVAQINLYIRIVVMDLNRY